MVNTYKESIQLLKERLKGEKEGRLEKIYTDTDGTLKSSLEANKSYSEALKNAHIFKISSPLSLMFWLTDTDTDISGVKLPFNKTFIDTKIKMEDYNILGVLLEYKEEKVSCSFILTSTIVDKEKGVGCSIGLESLFLEDLVEEGFKFNQTLFKNEEERKDFNKNLLGFILNFSDFLNNPDIEYIKKEYSPNELGSYERKYALSTTAIIVTGKLKRYCDNIAEYVTDVKYLRKAHWVRGHWRRFENDKFVHKKGQKTWIYPFIRGFGEAIKKEYNLKEN